MKFKRNFLKLLSCGKIKEENTEAAESKKTIIDSNETERRKSWKLPSFRTLHNQTRKDVELNSKHSYIS